MPIALNGSGSITGISAGGLPDGTVTQPDLATGVAGTGPAFMAIPSGTQSASAGTFTKLNFGTELYDTNNNFASGRFTPTVAGFYQINAATYISTGSQVECVMALYKNGSLAAYMQNVVVPLGRQCAGSVLIYMNGTTDYVEAYTYTSTTVTVPNDGNLVYFQGFLARAA